MLAGAQCAVRNSASKGQHRAMCIVETILWRVEKMKAITMEMSCELSLSKK